MNCPDETKIAMLQNGALTGREAAEIEVHLKKCAACRELYNELRFVDVLLRAAAPAQPEEYWKTMPGKLREKASCEQLGARRLFPPVLSKIFWGLTETAAAVIVICMISLFSSISGREQVAVSSARAADENAVYARAGFETRGQGTDSGPLAREIMKSAGDVW